MNSHMWLVVTVYRVGLELKKKKRWGPDHICPKLTGKKNCVIIFLYYKEAESVFQP